ncbi:uncharacterized protein LOC115986330 [Quercus lobata]|uniref:uncharacterized protein LOC115986330 n=1 Tax=Quercus lobata TaxID=97700 RepID=UPI001245F75B|nr:uncharacterized protein LOC115986330 [Quercus lobata]
MGFMIRVHLQSSIPFSMMIPMPICIHHQRRQKHNFEEKVKPSDPDVFHLLGEVKYEFKGRKMMEKEIKRAVLLHSC